MTRNSMWDGCSSVRWTLWIAFRKSYSPAVRPRQALGLSLSMRSALTQ